MRRRAAALATVALAASLGACGRGVDDDHQANARAAGTVFLKLCSQDRGRDLATLLNGPALDAFMRAGAVRRGCAVVLRQPGAPSPAAFATARITRVQTNGAAARLTVRLGRQGLAPGATAQLEAERAGDRWFVTSQRFGG